MAEGEAEVIDRLIAALTAVAETTVLHTKQLAEVEAKLDTLLAAQAAVAQTHATALTTWAPVVAYVSERAEAKRNEAMIAQVRAEIEAERPPGMLAELWAKTLTKVATAVILIASGLAALGKALLGD